MIRERAFAKANLVLHVGRPRDDGFHPLCSLFASLELADEVALQRAERDVVACPGVAGPNLCQRARDAFRGAAELPPARVAVEKRIPVAAGLGGGSADAAAVLRAANRLAGEPLGPDELRELAAGIGSDVPSQVEPRHAIVSGLGEVVEPVDLPVLELVLVPAEEGLRTGAVYAELDRAGGWRESLDPGRIRSLAEAGVERLAAAVENDLEPAAVSLRPELGGVIAKVRGTRALAAAVSGSGPTVFGLFAAADEADRAARELPGAIRTRTRAPA